MHSPNRQTPSRLTLLLFAAMLLVGCVSAIAQTCPSIIWSDEFSGTSLDQNKWEPMIGDGCDLGICGWGNQELQYYKAENAAVGSGVLTITAKKERVRGSQYTSARLRTLGMGDFTFGRFEARIKVPTGQGLWPAFWMLPTDLIYGTWPQSGEIDIMENIGREPSRVHGTIHFGQLYPDNSAQGGTYDLLQGAFADDFHTFAVEREPGAIHWFVDDVLYLTKTPADIAPENWPFDERFHFLLNVAVGGVFPGDPDATTVFPQTMEVDWVRVHDGSLPHIAGERVVPHQASGVTYRVGNAAAGASYTWQVPAGATIVAGQGTSEITVDWGPDGGVIQVDVSDACGSRTLTIDVRVEPNYIADVAFENFDDPSSLVPDLFTGTLVEIDNPQTGGINASARAGEYTRNAAETYDLLVWSTISGAGNAIPDAGAYVDGTRRFVLDILTDAPLGTQVILQLEDSSSATPDNYPTGRHSRYQATIETQGTWQRLELRLLDRPDGLVGDGAVDTMILLLAPNSQTGDVYVLDNLDGYVAEGQGPGGDPTAVHVGALTVGTEGVGQGKKRGVADVTIVDDLGNAVSGATVTVTFSGDIVETVMATTGTNGVARAETTATAGGNVSVGACVDSVAASLPYDPSANTQTCG